MVEALGADRVEQLRQRINDARGATCDRIVLSQNMPGDEIKFTCANLNQLAMSGKSGSVRRLH